jgi:hypothetical protein
MTTTSLYCQNLLTDLSLISSLASVQPVDYRPRQTIYRHSWRLRKLVATTEIEGRLEISTLTPV